MKVQLSSTHSDPGIVQALRERATRFELELTEEPSAYSLRIEPDGALVLKDAGGRKLSIDFDASGPDYRRKALRGRQELLSKALGGSKGARRVLDLSAGLGQDAVFLSQLGFEVTAVERHPLIAFLLKEARLRTRREDLSRLEILHGDSVGIVQDEAYVKGFDAVYFDPMYPSKKKSALPRQEMLLFRELVGQDEDASRVIDGVLGNLDGRLVIKRPLEAPPLVKPTHSFEGKTVRYDVIVRSV